MSPTSSQRIAVHRTAAAAPAFILQAFWDEMSTRGVSIRELEDLSGVARPRRDDLSSMLSIQDTCRLFESAFLLTGDHTLGLSVGRAMSCAGLHLVGHLVLASVSLRQAIELALSAGPYFREPVIEEIAEGRVRLGYYGRGAASAGARTLSQIAGMVLYDTTLRFLNSASQTAAVQLSIPAPADVSAYERAFSGGVQFGLDGTFIVFPRVVLDQRRSGADPAVAQQLLAFAREQYATVRTDRSDHPDHGDHADHRDWATRVRTALRANAAPRRVGPSALAGQLGVSPRGLWRRLAREATSFSALVEEILYERAKVLLSRPEATCADVAESLGYAELSSFHRAFRRWSGGITPNEHRQRQGRRSAQRPR